MLTAGLDIGSRTIALAVWDGARLVRADVVDTGADPYRSARALLDGYKFDHSVATGYGRHTAVERGLANAMITEIKAYALGSYHLYPDVQTVLDVGGQDTKVIAVRPDGSAGQFEMNDRCAAGTGRFFENMARALGMSITDFTRHALQADGPAVRLSSTCAVFAESEVVSLIGRGEDSRRVALGIHRGVASRLAAMVRRVGYRSRFVFAGGGALNACLHRLLEEELGISLTVADNPQLVGALGAALYAGRGGV